MTLLYLNHLFKGPISKQTHILRSGRFEFQHVNLGAQVSMKQEDSPLRDEHRGAGAPALASSHPGSGLQIPTQTMHLTPLARTSRGSLTAVETVLAPLP